MNMHFPKDKRLSNLLCQKFKTYSLLINRPKKRKKLEFHQENVVSGEKNKPFLK